MHVLKESSVFFTKHKESVTRRHDPSRIRFLCVPLNIVCYNYVALVLLNYASLLMAFKKNICA